MKHLLVPLVWSASLLTAVSPLPAAGSDIDTAFSGRYQNPEDVFALGEFVRAASDTGQFDQAISTLEEHLIRHADDGRARLALARLYANVGSWDLAVEQVTDALATGQLSGGEQIEASRLQRRASRAASGVEWFLDVSAGVRVTDLDVDVPYSSWHDRTDTGGYAKADGAVRFDLGTGLGDALIIAGSAEVDRHYEDNFLGDGPSFGLSDGDLFNARHGRVSLTYDMGLPVTSIDAARLQFGGFAEVQTYHQQIREQALGGLARLVLLPTVDTQIYGEVSYSDLSQSEGLLSQSRLTWEAGSSWRVAQSHTLGLLGRGLREEDDSGDATAEMSEVGVSYLGILPFRPFNTIWTHQLTGTIGTFSSKNSIEYDDIKVFTGKHWRIEWANQFHIDGQNRIDLSYSATRRNFDPAGNVPEIIEGQSSLTQSVSLGFTHRF
ncbi:hypothetical protein DFR52_103149 [Hoeflea marina]|uniref:Tetratricopeptide repeat protein n=1 Tax=Hoeflea marina TaxID=274592 RepID=A0A317PH46_9HYPH|nr:tetratricopeptide repeat protein [Hoeflea marina]PWV99948.1 hypothetical protein DFR52_103149 [Hoeflea marina]